VIDSKNNLVHHQKTTPILSLALSASSELLLTKFITHNSSVINKSKISWLQSSRWKWKSRNTKLGLNALDHSWEDSEERSSLPSFPSKSSSMILTLILMHKIPNHGAWPSLEPTLSLIIILTFTSNISCQSFFN
jgi:hypothetical protein